MSFLGENGMIAMARITPYLRRSRFELQPATAPSQYSITLLPTDIGSVLHLARKRYRCLFEWIVGSRIYANSNA